jgi:hypothetical protein
MSYFNLFMTDQIKMLKIKYLYYHFINFTSYFNLFIADQIIKVNYFYY